MQIENYMKQLKDLSDEQLHEMLKQLRNNRRAIAIRTDEWKKSAKKRKRAAVKKSKPEDCG